MTAVDTMAAWGVLRPADVVSIADSAALPLAAACALLEKESGGGRNVWGHDRVAVVGYTPGAPVTEASYRAYRRALAQGIAGQQGVGPCQLTSVSYQDRADALGGCWLPVPNMRVGFELLAGYIRRWGMADAFRAYNGGAGNRVAGSNVNADRYATGAMTLYFAWINRLGDYATGDDMPLTQADADLVVRTLLATPMLDLYPDKPVRNITVGETLQWAAANSGRAVFAVGKVREALAAGAIPAEVQRLLLDALADLGPLALVKAP